MRRRLDLNDRVVLVTGGARGIGFEVARAAAARGAMPALIDVDGDAVAAARRRLGGRAHAFQADVTDADALEAAFDEASRRLGGIDVVVANAGIAPLATTVDAGDRAHQRRVLDVNLHGVWHTAWAGGPQVARRRGHFVIISSIASFVVTPSWAAYSASKAAVEQLGRSMRIELAPTGATVGVAHFGVIDTDLVRTFESDPLSARLEERAPRAVVRKSTPDAAAAALVRGIERRAPRTVFPRRWWGPYAFRGIVGPLGDAVLARHSHTRGVMAQVRERDAGAHG